MTVKIIVGEKYKLGMSPRTWYVCSNSDSSNFLLYNCDNGQYFVVFSDGTSGLFLNSSVLFTKNFTAKEAINIEIKVY